MAENQGRSRRDFLAGCGAGAIGLAGLPGCRLGGDSEAQQTAPTRPAQPASSIAPVAPATSGRKVIAGAIRTRKSIDALTAAELKVYADAIRAMRRLPASNPHSLAAQAKIHGDHCAHGTWNFLPWHRPYLGYFEEAVRKVSGNDAFALPYWDWTANRGIPRAFADSSSPLYDDSRQFLPLMESEVGQATVDSSLSTLLWEDFMGSARGGGNIEGTPHGYVHVAVGGNMGELANAGLDPLFWLHHCNVDRLWESWMKANGFTGHTVAAQDRTWRASALARFWDRNGKAASVTTADTLDSRNFGFVYDRLHTRSSQSTATQRGRLLSLQTVPQNQIIKARSTNGSIASFRVGPAAAGQIAALGAGPELALAGSQGTSTTTAAALRTVSLILEGNFPNKSTLVVKASNGTRLASFHVFAHHMNRVHLSLTTKAASFVFRNGTCDLAIEVNGRTATNVTATLVFA